MSQKLTMLERYCKMRLELDESFKNTIPTAAQFWSYQELVYRIGVLETFQQFAKLAPVSPDAKILIQHYLVVNGFIEHLKKERFNPTTDPEMLKKQQTAQASLISVIDDYRKRYSSYQSGNDDQYKQDIGRTIAAVLSAWMQYRDTVTEISIKTEEAP